MPHCVYSLHRATKEGKIASFSASCVHITCCNTLMILRRGGSAASSVSTRLCGPTRIDVTNAASAYDRYQLGSLPDSDSVLPSSSFSVFVFSISFDPWNTTSISPFSLTPKLSSTVALSGTNGGSPTNAA
jgi:hypothetical protein